MSRLITLLSGVAIGAALAHFLDPQSGRQRRDQATGEGPCTRPTRPGRRRQAKGAAGKAKGAAAGASRAATASRTSTT